MSAAIDAVSAPRAVVLQHEAAVHLGNFEAVLVEAGYAVETVDAEQPGFAEALASPETTAADLVVLLGSNAAVYEGERYDFIAPELAFVRERMAAERPTLGVCFGAQLIAAALGAEVRRGAVVDVGYRELALTDAGAASPVRHFAEVRAAEWHGDTFELPAGVERLASSARYANEAYGAGDWLLAVQFHPELTDAMHEDWLVRGERYVEAAGYSPAALRAERAAHGAAQQAASAAMLRDYLARLPA